MKTKSLAVFFLLSAVAGTTRGADIRYSQSGDWFLTEAVGGIGWQSPGIPGAGDNARANWGDNTITLNGVAPDVSNVQLGVDESGTLEVNDGGVLTAINDVLAGNNNTAATGTLTVNDGGIVNVGRILWAAQLGSDGFININAGGVVNVASHLWLGVTGTAEINITGVLNQTGGILGLGTSDATNASGGTATVNINDGGLLALNNISGNPGEPSIQSGSVLNINGSGRLTLPEDFVDVIYRYIDDSKITGNGITGRTALNVDLTTNPGFTTVTAAPAGPEDDQLRITDFDFNEGTGVVSFTWNSVETESFKIDFSKNLIDWDGELEESYPAAVGQNFTTYELNRSNLLGAETAGAVYFRVERVD